MSAMEALGHVGPPAAAARQRIAELTRDSNEEIAEVAKAALEKLAPSEQPPAAKETGPAK
jgi:hypothetical protein